MLGRKDQCPGEVQAEIHEFRREGEQASVKGSELASQGEAREQDPDDEECW